MRPTNRASDHPVVIVGAGLAGLCCARRLRQLGAACRIVEASDGVGGRVRTDLVGGFRLDRGFQVLLTAYEEARAVLDYGALGLRAFAAGAVVWRDGRFHRLFDPLRHPSQAPGSAFSPLMTLGDKARAAKLWLDVRQRESDELLVSGEDRRTDEELRARGFSDHAIESFFRPFFGGIYLTRDLSISSRFFRYVFRMFSDGHAALPADGMGAIATQLSRQIGDTPLALNTPVAAVETGGVRLAGGRFIAASAVVVATDGASATRLLGLPASAMGRGAVRSARTLYFDADRSPLGEAVLALDGEGHGPVNHLAVVSDVQSGYAPQGRSLISLSVVGHEQLGDEQLMQPIRRQMRNWFGASSDCWQHLRTYRIEHALPPFDPGSPPARTGRVRAGLYACGDWTTHPSIQGAMVSGRRCAEAVAMELSPP